MSNQLSVSIVIPAYNEAKRIQRTLEALRRQSLLPYEIIVVDNNSTDNTADIARSYENVRVVNESQQGIGHARNRGFDEAAGDIIARLDADTIPSDTWIEAIAERFSTQPILGGIAGPSAPKELQILGTTNAARLYGLFRRWHERSIGVSPMLYGCNMALRREAWRHISSLTSPGDTQIAEDVEVTVLLNKTGYKTIYEPRMLIRFDWVHGLLPKKLWTYYHNDNYTLKKLRYGNTRRRV